MRYYDEDRRSRKWAAAAVMLYAAVCVVVMFLTYTITMPQPETGMIIDFGTGEDGFGEEDPALSDADPAPVSSPPQPRNDPEQVMTTEEEEAPAIAPPPRPTSTRPRPQPQQRPTPAPPTPAPPAPERRVDSRALFPGRTQGGTATSQGNTGAQGNQGTTEGAPGGGATEGGSGVAGFSLAGRNVVGGWPRPAYDVEVEGRVVISITVNAAGVVTGAAYQGTGSTTNNSTLREAARAAAMRSRFTPRDDGSDAPQTGTITYIFRLDR